MDRDAMLKQLTILDFMAVDLHLYLNTHPNDKEAIEKYNNVNILADKARCVYEKNFGPLCSYRSLSDENEWHWIDKPWPWNEEFNFKLQC